MIQVGENPPWYDGFAPFPNFSKDVGFSSCVWKPSSNQNKILKAQRFKSTEVQVLSEKTQIHHILQTSNHHVK